MFTSDVPPSIVLARLRIRPRTSLLKAGLAAFGGRFQEAVQLLTSASDEAVALGDGRLLAGASLLAAVVKSIAGTGGVEEADDVLANPVALPEWRLQARAEGPARLVDLPSAATLLDPDQTLLGRPAVREPQGGRIPPHQRLSQARYVLTPRAGIRTRRSCPAPVRPGN